MADYDIRVGKDGADADNIYLSIEKLIDKKAQRKQGKQLTPRVLSIEDINPFSNKKLLANIPSADKNHDHILGLLQKCYQPMDAAETSLPDHKGRPESILTSLSYSAADLSRA
ncbi:hypothetical protein Tco_0456112 [Tanacetum coccineum]